VKWKKQAQEGLVIVFEKSYSSKEAVNNESDKLYQEIGRLQVENAFLKKCVSPSGA